MKYAAAGPRVVRWSNNPRYRCAGSLIKRAGGCRHAQRTSESQGIAALATI